MLKLTNENFIYEYLDDLLEKKIEELKKDYEKNRYIDQAIITRNGENINIELILNIEVDERQDIVNLFERGGVILNNEDSPIEIFAGNYIRRNLLN